MSRADGPMQQSTADATRQPHERQYSYSCTRTREKGEVTASHRHSSAHAAATAAAATVMRAHAVLRAQKGSGPPPGDAMNPA